MLERTLSVVAIAALTLNAAADLVTFPNTDKDFRLVGFNVTFGEPGQALDITQPVTSQPAFGDESPGWTVHVRYQPGVASRDGNWQWLSGGVNSSIARSSVPTEMQEGDDGLPIVDYGPEMFSAGDTIGAGQDWQVLGLLSMSNDYGRWDTIPTDPVVVGVRLELADGTHYGYIELQRYTTGTSQFRHYRPLSWGYETEVNTPITIIPAPAGVVALGMIGAVARRRR